MQASFFALFASFAEKDTGVSYLFLAKQAAERLGIARLDAPETSAVSGSGAMPMAQTNPNMPRTDRPAIQSHWLGPRQVIPLSPCALCHRRTFAAYGSVPLCLDCAIVPTTPTNVAYREALRRFWTLAADGECAHPAASQEALDELARRLDDVGEPAATEHRRRWENEWHRESGKCPRCGETGPRHDA